MTSQSYTLIDPAGNQAQYTVYDADRRNEYSGSSEDSSKVQHDSEAAPPDHRY